MGDWSKSMNLHFEMEKFRQEINQSDEKIDLAKASLYFARMEYPELDVEEYLNALDTMAEELREILPVTSYPLKIIQSINQYLFQDLGFKGNTDNYYDPDNSFLNQVIERRTGIPITLSVIYLEIAKRINFPMVGIGMPGHFLIRPQFEDVGIFVDAFHQGEILFREDCQQRLQEIYQQSITLKPEFLAAVSHRQILARMLSNLKFIYLNQQQLSQALTVVELILLMFPDNLRELRDRDLISHHLTQQQKAKEN